MVDALLAWKPSSPTLPGRLEELYVLMYELGIVERNDVLLAQAWIADLIAVGYRFPPLQGSKPVGKRNYLRKNGTAAAAAATGRRGLAAPHRRRRQSMASAIIDITPKGEGHPPRVYPPRAKAAAELTFTFVLRVPRARGVDLVGLRRRRPPLLPAVVAGPDR